MPSPSQMPDLHSVPLGYWRQPPLPSQVPSRPQVAGVVGAQARGSVGFTPGGTKAQSPRALGRLQALQISAQAEVQQIPPTQNPVWHSRSQLQDSALFLDLPGASGAQVLGCAAASDVPETSEDLASLFPPSGPPPSLPLGSPREEPILHPVTPRTAHRTREPQQASPFPKDDCDS
jgi:hypothetical protein